jgi:uncharacterized membrane protein YczE
MTAEVADTVERYTAKEDYRISHAGFGGTLVGNALTLRALRTTLEQVMTDGAYAHMSSLAERFESGVVELIGVRGLPWHVTRLGARVEYLFSRRAPRSGGEVAAAGVALLASYGLDLRFGLLYVLVNLPFLLLAGFRLGWWFVGRTLLGVALVGGFAELHPAVFEIAALATPYAVVVGNLLIGIGMLVLFRHGASLGGFNVVALLAQQRLGWRAGYVQMALDITVILAALAVVDPGLVLWSALGGAVLNLVLALNHRPGRYLGA